MSEKLKVIFVTVVVVVFLQRLRVSNYVSQSEVVKVVDTFFKNFKDSLLLDS